MLCKGSPSRQALTTIELIAPILAVVVAIALPGLVDANAIATPELIVAACCGANSGRLAEPSSEVEAKRGGRGKGNAQATAIRLMKLCTRITWAALLYYWQAFRSV